MLVQIASVLESNIFLPAHHLSQPCYLMLIYIGYNIDANARTGFT